MAEYIIHDGATVLNRIVANSTIEVESGQICIEAIAPWDGFIGQAVDANGVVAPATIPLTIDEQRAKLQSIRNASLQSILHDFGDGRVLQVRPQDAGNINMAIGIGVDTEWVMQDNSVALITVAELQVALDSGIAQGKSIWDQYMTDLKAL